jgi:hypothetical protein
MRQRTRRLAGQPPSPALRRSAKTAEMAGAAEMAGTAEMAGAAEGLAVPELPKLNERPGAVEVPAGSRRRWLGGGDDCGHGTGGGRGWRWPRRSR